MLLGLGAQAQKKGASPDNTLSAAEKKQGFVLLFDGQSLAGWKTYGADTIAPSWVVEEGAIHFNKSRKGGDLVTKAQYESFELLMDWKISEGGNSGIFYHGVDDKAKYGAIYHTAPEYQVLDDEKHPDGKFESHRASANYDLIVPKAGLTKPVGEWNQTRIVVNKGQVEHWLNGTLSVKYTLGSPEWEALVAKSKFVKWPDYGRAKAGVIGLQDHGDKVWYKNIKLRVIS